MATITLSLSTRVDQRGKSEILIRFVGGRDHIFRLHSRMSVPSDRFKDGAIIVPRLETDEQKSLKEIRAKLLSIQETLLEKFEEADKDSVTREWMQNVVDTFHHPEKSISRDFMELFDEFCHAKDVSQARLAKLDVVKRSLLRFETVSGQKLTLGNFTLARLEKYRDFLTDEHKTAATKKWKEYYDGLDKGQQPKKRGKNAILEYTRIMRTFYLWLDKRGIPNAHPFNSFEMGAAIYGTPYYLTIEERDRIAAVDLEGRPNLAIQRDIFIFQCLTGCRVGDLAAFRKTDVVDGVLSYIPHKTRTGNPTTVRVPLTDTAREIVERYAFLRGDRLLPCISPQKYNVALKEIFKAAGVTRIVTVLDPLTREEVKLPLNRAASSHLARRTFIGNLYKQIKDPNIIGSMSGHTEGSRAFARYRDIDDDIRADVVQLLEKKKQQ